MILHVFFLRMQNMAAQPQFQKPWWILMDLDGMFATSPTGALEWIGSFFFCIRIVNDRPLGTVLESSQHRPYKREYDSDRFNLQQIFVLETWLKTDQSAFKTFQNQSLYQFVAICSHDFPDFPPKQQPVEASKASSTSSVATRSRALASPWRTSREVWMCLGFLGCRWWVP